MFRVIQLQRDNDNWKADVYTPPVVAPGGRVDPVRFPKATEHFADSYTLGNGWRKHDRFKVETQLTVWAKNNTRNSDPEECTDDASDILVLD